MTASLPFTPPTPAPQLLPADTRLGAVHLDVTDGERAKTFWTQYVGLPLIREDDDGIVLGVDGDEMIVLHPGASGPVERRHTGLYHVAIHLPSKKELARVVARLFELRCANSPTDHAETMATYFSDPDGNRIELTFETPERGALALGDGSGLAIMADGSTQGPTEPLDVHDLLSSLGDEDDLSQSMAIGTRIGHVHLHVKDLHAARAFYRDVIGMGVLRFTDGWGMADMSLETSFVPHALAFNVWNGPSATPKPEGTSGLRHWTLRVPTADALEAVVERLTGEGVAFEQDNEGIIVPDPFSNRLRIAVS